MLKTSYYNPATKNFALNEEQTKRLLQYMEEPTCEVQYEKNNRLKEGRELLTQLSAQYSQRC